MSTQQQQAADVAYNEVNCSQHCKPLDGGDEQCSRGAGGPCEMEGPPPSPPPPNAPPVREEEWRETADGGAWGVAGEWNIESLASLASRTVVLRALPGAAWRLLAARLPHDIAVLLHHAAARKKLQDKMVRVSQKCALVCKPLTLGQVLQLEGGYIPPQSNTCRLRLHWQHKEFYGLFDGLSASGDEAWTRGINLWPLTLCLKSLPGVFGDEDLVQEWIEVQESRGLPKENCCAWPTWLPLGCESESTFFFINCAPSSPYYGQLRYIVNNVQDDRFLAPSFSKFFSLVEQYLDQTGGGEDAPRLVEWVHQRSTSAAHRSSHNAPT